MAIYHFSVKAISRSTGRSAVACAAYRSGEKLVDKYYGNEQDYTKKTGVEFTNIYAPQKTKTNLLNRQELWNEVEKSECRKDAVLAREFEVAFPSEFNEQQRKIMLDDICKELVNKHGVIVDAAIHAPHIKNGSDERNFHAHIMFTSRSIDSETGLFAKKKYRDFNIEKSRETVKQWREYFADLTNRHLDKNGFTARVSHLSNKNRGIDLEATQHEGSTVTVLRRKYEKELEKNIEDRDLSISMPRVAQANDDIKKRNAGKLVQDYDQQISITEKLLEKAQIDLDHFKENDLDQLKISYCFYIDYTIDALKEAKLKKLIETQNILEERFQLSKANEPTFFGRSKWINKHNSIIDEFNLNNDEIKDLEEKSKEELHSDFSKRAKEIVDRQIPEILEKITKLEADRKQEIIKQMALEKEANRRIAEEKKRVNEEMRAKRMQQDFIHAFNRLTEFQKSLYLKYKAQTYCEDLHPNTIENKIEDLKLHVICDPDYFDLRHEADLERQLAQEKYEEYMRKQTLKETAEPTLKEPIKTKNIDYGNDFTP